MGVHGQDSQWIVMCKSMKPDVLCWAKIKRAKLCLRDLARQAIVPGYKRRVNTWGDR